jgi:CRISPR-associated endonuclease/helicase Cas3
LNNIESWHHLIAHSADVAAITEALLGLPVLSSRLARLAGRNCLDEITVARLAALAFLHDIGKANRGFQARQDLTAPPVGHIDQLLWLTHTPDAEELRGRLYGVLGLDRMEAWFSGDASLDLFDAVYAHHGRPWRVHEVAALPNWRALWQPGADGDPIAALAPLQQAMDAWFAPAFGEGPSLPDLPAFHHAFAGIVMLADWLGSDERFFPMADGTYEGRMAEARRQAPHALAAVGLAIEPRRRAAQAARRDFQACFGLPSPRPVQITASEILARCLVLESETGSGKTEAALWRFKTLFERGEVDGIYFALPTRVAATQVFDRVLSFRDRLFAPEDRLPVVLAVPGQVRVDTAAGHPLPDFGFEWSDDPDGGTARARWAAEHPKRFLAAQIAVGTVDQALLGAIRVKHAHLRGTALLRHLLVIDEVHASDRYMEDVLSELLRSHLGAGGHALLLSATLGAGMRARLLGTPCPPPDEAAALPYPAVTWAEAGRERRAAWTSDRSEKAVQLRAAPYLDDPAWIARRAFEAVEAGAKVLVLRNTVGAAVATAAALEQLAGANHPALFRIGDVPTLHHGRFAAVDRQLLDQAVEQRFGRTRPDGGAVVVGTQTLEVSLDLDADLMIVDLCPADVLLQRLGRLHRHPGRTRPVGFANPQAWVLVPDTRDLLDVAERRGRHGLGRVYEDWRILEATWRLLARHDAWQVPAMNRMLVEEATHPAHLEQIEAEWRGRDARWARHLDAVTGKNSELRKQAAVAVLDRRTRFRNFILPPDERLATRLGARDRLVEVPPSLRGPFGVLPGALRIPQHLLEGIDAATDAKVWEDVGVIHVELGGRTLRYDRWGLGQAQK